MAEITGGELNYAVTVDVDQLKKSLTDAEGNLQGFSDVAELTGEKLDNALKGNVVENLKKIGLQSGLTGKDMKNAIKDAEDFVKGMEIGLKGVLDYQTKLGKEINNMPAGEAQATLLQEYDDINGKVEEVSLSIENSRKIIQDFKDENASLTTKLRDVKEEMQQLIQLGQKDSEKYSELSAKAKEYTQNIDQLNAEMKALGGNPGLDLLVESLGLAAGVFATTQGVMGLLVGESENLDKVMVQMQATMSVAIGLQQIQNALKSDGTVITRVMAVQELARARAADIAAASTGRATVAQRFFNLVANANPYILLATAILTVVGALALYSAASSESAKRTKLMTDMNKQMADSVAEPIISFKKLQIQWNALGNDLKAKEKFVKDNKERFQELGVSVNNVNDAENLLIKNSVNFQAALMMRARAAAAASIAADKYKEALNAQLQDEQEKRTLKGGSYIEQQNTRLKREARDLVGATLAEISKQGFSDANYATKLNVGYDQSAKDFLKKGNITEFVKPEKVKKEKITKEIKADEYFPPGSVAEIQKRIAAIDEALSKATNSGTIEALKNKRIAIAEELAEALKRIEIKSLEDRANEQEKFANAYLIIEQNLGKEAAEKMYGPLMEGAQSYYGWLTNEQDKLFQKQSSEILTEKDKSNLVFLTQKIDEIQGKKNAFQNFTNGIDEALSKIPTLAGQIEFLQNKATEQLESKGNKSFDDGEQKYLQEQADQREKQLKDNYQSFLNEHQNYEEQKKAITDKYNELRIQAKTPEEKKKIAKAEKSETSQLELGFLKESDDWKMAFGDVELFTQNTIQRILANLIKYRDEKKDALQPTEERELAEAISRLQAAANRNPFIKIIEGLKSMKTARIAVINAEKEYQAILAANGGNLKSDEAVAAYKKLTKAEQEAADKKKAFISGVQETQSVFNAVGEGVLELGEAFGGMSDATKDAIGDIMAIGNAAMDFATSIASGDVAGMIKAGIKVITSVFNALSGDKKKEREIKKQQEAIKSLELAYNDLAFAAERAFGSQKYDGQRDLIKNLQEQKIAIEAMMRAESSKKKKDKDKIAGYQQQIQSINQSIASLKEVIIKDVLQTDIPQMASSIGDALLEAFGKGEDGIKAVDDAFDQMVKNILKNQLNKVLEKQMEGVYKNFLIASGFSEDGTGTFNGLTPEQIADLKAQVQAASSYGQQFIEAYGSIFEGLDSPSEGLKGDIKGITEKTAGALEAQINAIRIYQVEGLNIQKNNQLLFVQSLQNLVLIEANTRNLIQIRQDISEMNGKMKKGLAGFP